MAYGSLKQRLSRFLLLFMSLLWISGIVYAYQISPSALQANDLDEEETPQSVLQKYQTELSDVHQSYKRTIASYYEVVQNEYIPQLDSTYNAHYSYMQSMYNNYDGVTQTFSAYSSDMYNECVLGKQELLNIYNDAQSRQVTISANESALQSVQRYQTELSDVYTTYKQEIESLNENAQNIYLPQMLEKYNSWNNQIQSLIDNYYESLTLSDYVNQAANYCSQGKAELKAIRDDAIANNPREPYAVLDGTTLYFYYDDQKTARNGMSVGPFTVTWNDGGACTVTGREWENTIPSITTAVFDESFGNCTTVTSTAGWFCNDSNLVAIRGIEHLKTENVTDMRSMFYGCSKLTSLDVSNFNTANATNLRCMFDFCSSLTSLDVNKFKTANVTDMSRMFDSCQSLMSLDVSNFNTANVTNMSGMFDQCNQLVSLDVSNFNTANVTDMSFMFTLCKRLTSLDVSNFNTANVTDMSRMFAYCSSLTSLDVSNFNTVNVTDMAYMFSHCYSLTSLNVSRFKTGNVTDMSRMFDGCEVLNTIYAGDGWSTVNVTEGAEMFSECTNLVGGAGTTYDANHIDHAYARIDGGPNSQTPGYFTAKRTAGGLEIYAIEKGATVTPNQPITATQSIIVTPGNDSEWLTDMSMGSAWENPLEFTASIYYPNSSATHTFVNSMRGTNNPKDGELTDGVSSGNGYKHTQKNLPQSGGFLVFEALQNGSLIVPVRVFANKQFYVVDANGKTKTDIQFKDADGNTLSLMTDPLCAVSTEEITGFVSFNVVQGEKYYIFCTGSKVRFGGYVFSPESITIDPATMANVKSILEASVSTALDTDFASGIGDWTIVDATTLPEGLTYIWKYDEPNKYMKASAYASGKSYASDSWLISPAFTLASEGAMTVSHTQRYAASGCTDLHIMVSSTYAGGAINASEWTEVTPDQWPDGTNWLFINSAATIPAGTTRIAFRYTSTESTAGTWEIKSVSIKGQALPSAVKPTFSWNGDQLTMTTETDGADIYYSVKEYEAEPAGDGSESNPYNVAGVLKYISTLGADVQSEQEVYVKGVVSSIQSPFDTTYGNAVFNVSDNGKNQNYLTAYRALYLQNQRYTSGQRQIQVGDDVVLFGKVVNYKGSTPETVSGAAYLYSMEEPDLQNRYENPITVSGNVVIRAKATKQGLDDSDLAMTYSGTEPYAVLSENNTVLNFFYDDKKRANSGMDLGPFKLNYNVYADGYTVSVNGREWEDKVSTITTVVFDPSFANCTTLNSTAGWFCNDSNLVAIRGIEYLNTESITDMSGMFWACKSLTTIDVSSFKTSNVTNMWAMFDDCTSLTTIKFSDQFITSKVTNMQGMFYACSSLTSMDLSGFDVAQVTYFNSMFRGCTKLENLNLTGWNTSSALGMQYMFRGCSSLKSLDLSGFNTQNVTSVLGMFDNCSSLTSLNVSNFDTQNVKDMQGMFDNCSSLTSLDVSNFNTQNVKFMAGMFYGCSGLTSLDVSNFKTDSVTVMNHMFRGCSKLESLNLSGWNTSKVTTMMAMFSRCESLTNLDVSGFNTETVTDINQMFYNCSKLKSLDLSNFRTPNLKEIHGLFYRCEALESLDISNLNTSQVTDFHSIFYGCASLKSLDISHFDTSQATEMALLFARCSSLASIQAGNAAIPDSIYAQIGNPNLLLYVNEASLAPASVTNVVVDGAAENIVLTDVEQGNNNFYCPQEFTARRISYTHNYRQATQVGVSRGWETIVLPFTVQTITHEKNGLLAPFGVDGGKPFWLRQLTDKGLVSAQQIEANMPYLISMPNNGRYPADYNQAGNVTFSATNVVVPMTEQREMSGNNRMLIPTTMRVAQSPSVYAINSNAPYENNPEGSIFVADYREVRPFEAYVEHTNGARFISLDDLSEGDVTNIQAIHDIASADVVKVYNLSGVLLKTGKRQEVMSQLPKGIYIVNGVKVVVK